MSQRALTRLVFAFFWILVAAAACRTDAQVCEDLEVLGDLTVLGDATAFGESVLLGPGYVGSNRPLEGRSEVFYIQGLALPDEGLSTYLLRIDGNDRNMASPWTDTYGILVRVFETYGDRFLIEGYCDPANTDGSDCYALTADLATAPLSGHSNSHRRGLWVHQDLEHGGHGVTIGPKPTGPGPVALLVSDPDLPSRFAGQVSVGDPGDATRTYLEIDTTVGPPPAEDCTAPRMITDPMTGVLYVCNGARGWDGFSPQAQE